MNAFTIDENLNWTAIQRAVEAIAVAGHRRPDGSEAWTATRSGRAFTGESLAFGNVNLRSAIVEGWGKGELNALRASNGSQEPSGHLHQLINPKNRAYGFGAISAPGTQWGRYLSAVSSENVVTKASAQGGSRSATIYRAAKPGERPTGVVNQGNANIGNSGSSAGGAIAVIIGIVATIAALIGGIGFTLTIPR